MKKLRASYDVPHDIVESILFRLPVKSLLRFKGVCKQWSATISDDPNFAETYLQRSITSSSSYLQYLYWKFCFRRIQLENNKIRNPSIVECSLEGYGCSSMLLLGSYDGIFLFVRRGSTKDYLVWNPSTRTHREMCCTHPIFGDNNLLSGIFGICYDPLLKDYKVVIGGDTRNYAVYYCKTNSWSEMKEMNNNVKIDYYRSGVHFKGSIYWIFCSGSKDDGRYMFETVCFDGRDEQFKNCGSVDCLNNSACSSGDCLYFIPKGYRSDFNSFEKMVVMKKDGHDDDPWMELELELPFPCEWLQPLCWMTRENQIMFRAFNHGEKAKYFIYGTDTNRSYATQIHSTYWYTNLDLYPNLENLLLL